MSSRSGTVSPPSSTSDDGPYCLPSQYQFLKVLGEGAFGSVLKCLKKDTQETVAIKIPIHAEVRKEATLLKKFMRHNFDQRNIVKFLDSFDTEFGKALVFEELDISLDKYIIKTRYKPMKLRDIRNIIRQIATALDALKSLGMIHTDIKLDNIMLVDQQIRPLEVKLIDFGLALPTRKVKQGKKLQVEDFRAPEIVLGLSYDEGIDMWSLGCVMAVMVTGYLLFPADNEYELLEHIVRVLGQPADHLLNDGMYTKRYFTRTETDGWRLQTPRVYWGVETEDTCFGLSSLDNLKKARLERHNKTENLEREQCIELLKAMLTIDPAQRITPCEVLNHPFISWTKVDDSSSIDDSIKTYSIEDSDSLCSATTEDTLSLECSPSLLPQEDEILRCLTWTVNTTSIQSDNCRTLSSMTDGQWWFQVQSDSEDRSGLRTSSSEDSGCEPPANTPEDRDITTTQSDDHSPSPTIIPSRVIYVRPATPENTWENLGNTDSFLPNVINISRNGLRTSSSEDSGCEPPANTPEDRDTTTTRPDDRSPSPTIIPSRVIYVRPATPENTWENLGNTDSLQAGLTETSEPLVTDTNNDASTPEDSTACGEKQSPQLSSPASQLVPKKKKKKNCFRRLCSWMRKKLLTCVDDNEEE